MSEGVLKLKDAISSKVKDVSSTMGKFTQNKLTHLKKWNSSGYPTEEGLSPPPFSFTEDIISKDCNAALQCLSAQHIEQLYYLFKSVASTDTGRATMSQLMLLLPAVVCSDVQVLIYLLFSETVETALTFKQFLSTLCLMRYGTAEEKLAHFYKGVVRRYTPQIQTVHCNDLLSYLRTLADFLCKMELIESDMEDLMEYYINQFVNKRRFYNDGWVNQAEFASGIGSISGHEDAFGLYRLIALFTLDRVQGKLPFLSKDCVWVMQFPMQKLFWQPEKEGFLLKEWKSITERWTVYWVVVSHGFFYYYSDLESYETPDRVLSLTNATVTRITSSKYPFAFSLTKNDTSRSFACKSEKALASWLEIITKNISTPTFPHSSTFPERISTAAETYVDGEEGFIAIRDALLTARHSIYISDWFFSPELYLTRDKAGHFDDQLKALLERKAKEGVKIHIMLWNETKIVLPLNSEKVQKSLEKIDGIIVLRHPLVDPMKWSHHQKIVVVDQQVALLGGLDLCFGRWDTQTHPIMDTAHHIFVGKDYYNPVVAGFGQYQAWNEDPFDRHQHPRMGWHDIHVKIQGQAAWDVSRNFIERWNHARLKLERSEVPFLYPQRSTHQSIYTGSCKVQVVRSLGHWHCNNIPEDTPEKSIYELYLKLIADARHMVYIENQFFISSNAGPGKVFNQIADALYNKVVEAIQAKRVFRVIVILPVHPDGTYKDDASIRYIMNWQYKTISRGPQSLRERFNFDFPHLEFENYFSFNALRNFARFGERAVTEQIYVHSKLMIVDDRYAVIGSANINDRSFMGDRDSEIAVYLEDTLTVNMRMNGQPFQGNHVAHQLRVKLWREHLGIEEGSAEEAKLLDPVIDDTFVDLWQAVAAHNSRLYNQVFPGMVPDDSITDLGQMESRHEVVAAPLGVELEKTRGHLVRFPLLFLDGFQLTPKLSDIEMHILEDDVFT